MITLHQVSGVPAGAGPLTSAGSPVDIQLDNGAQTGDVLIQYRLSPTAEVLGQPVGVYYDLATGEWAEVPSTYDPATRVVTLTTSHLSIFDVFYWPIDKVSDAAAGVWNWATADVFKNVDSPTCENDAVLRCGDRQRSVAVGFVERTADPLVHRD